MAHPTLTSQIIGSLLIVLTFMLWAGLAFAAGFHADRARARRER